MRGIHHQPYNGTFLNLFASALVRDEFSRYSRLSIMAAYAKSSGVKRIAPYVHRLTLAGGSFRAVIGLGQTNTSFQALQELLGLTDEVYVFHDEAWTSTFHPKIYLMEGRDKYVESWLSVGSSNLTAGGFETNYESNVYQDLFHDTDELKATLKLFNDATAVAGGFAKKLDLTLLKELVGEGYLGDERDLRAKLIATHQKSSAVGKKKLFSTSKRPQPTAAAKKLSKTSPSTPTVPMGFYKRLSKNDTSQTSSPGQIQIPIEFLSHFPALGEPEVMPSGGTQSEAFFNVVFVGADGTRQRVENARIILYEPAPDHPRPNIELRYTFRSQEILEELSPDDVLVFKRTTDPTTAFEVRHVPSSSPKRSQFEKRWEDL